jgi:tRNA-binding protein
MKLVSEKPHFLNFMSSSPLKGVELDLTRDRSLPRDQFMKIISYDQFEQVELRSGTITRAEEFPRAKKPAYKIWADFGPEFGILQTSAQVTVYYKPEDLVGRCIVGCLNLGERNIAGFLSQFLLVGFPDSSGAICLLKVEPKVPNGQKLC